MLNKPLLSYLEATYYLDYLYILGVNYFHSR
nr:MAG TPA: hypothetical protein [Caudoviricetes sp.]